MNVISVRQGVFEESDDGVDIVFAHLADVFEYESEGFETTVTDVQLGCSVFVKNGRDASEGTTSLGDDG